jgi:hypothetical protein
MESDRITLFHLMKNLHLDELAAAGGNGTDIMREIKRQAVRVRSPTRRDAVPSPNSAGSAFTVFAGAGGRIASKTIL